MKPISIKVTVADRPYRIKALPNESEKIRQSAQVIQDKMKQMRTEYGVTDKQDALAMTSLLLSTELIENQEINAQTPNNNQNDDDLIEKLNELDNILTEFLQKI